MATMAQIRELNKDYAGTIQARKEAENSLNEALHNFIEEVKTYILAAKRQRLSIGSAEQGIIVASDGQFRLNGIFTRSILNGYIDAFASILQDAINKETKEIDLLK